VGNAALRLKWAQENVSGMLEHWNMPTSRFLAWFSVLVEMRERLVYGCIAV
jgi:hypothetical protein